MESTSSGAVLHNQHRQLPSKHHPFIVKFDQRKQVCKRQLHNKLEHLVDDLFGWILNELTDIAFDSEKANDQQIRDLKKEIRQYTAAQAENLFTGIDSIISPLGDDLENGIDTGNNNNNENENENENENDYDYDFDYNSNDEGESCSSAGEDNCNCEECQVKGKNSHHRALNHQNGNTEAGNHRFQRVGNQLVTVPRIKEEVPDTEERVIAVNDVQQQQQQQQQQQEDNDQQESDETVEGIDKTKYRKANNMDKKGDLDRHLIAVHNVFPYICSIDECNQAFKSEVYLSDHLANDHLTIETYSCNRCHVVYTEYRHLYAHEWLVHETCDILCMQKDCGYRPPEYVLRDGAANGQLSGNDKQLMCTYPNCGKLLKDKRSLKSHYMTHREIRPYTCTVCSKVFNHNSTAIRHIRTIHLKNHPTVNPRQFLRVTAHTTPSPPDTVMLHPHQKIFACPNCPSKFSTKDNLETHIRVVHQVKLIVPVQQTLHQIVPQQVNVSTNGQPQVLTFRVLRTAVNPGTAGFGTIQIPVCPTISDIDGQQQQAVAVSIPATSTSVYTQGPQQQVQVSQENNTEAIQDQDESSQGNLVINEDPEESYDNQNNGQLAEESLDPEFNEATDDDTLAVNDHDQPSTSASTTGAKRGLRSDRVTSEMPTRRSGRRNVVIRNGGGDADPLQPGNEETDFSDLELGPLEERPSKKRRNTKPDEVDEPDPGDDHFPGIGVLHLKCTQEKCGKLFRERWQFYRHLQEAHKTEPFACPVKLCTASFESGSDLSVHVRGEHKHTPIWHCKKCPKRFRYFRQLLNHSRNSHIEGRFKCPREGCLHQGRNRHEVVLHIRTVHPEAGKVSCEDCGLECETVEEMRSHQRSHYLDDRPYWCKWVLPSGLECKFNTHQRYPLVMHIRKSHFARDSNGNPADADTRDPSPYIMDRSSSARARK